ncbi:hypothetical protein NQ314_002704 [Rhamnusium bicolor]|uniref:Protein kintoun n=1 Tax=Rhamnusium bicolor TaxID=1586634 RepID=A0AAV8ZQ95_9CUCU|nr:hypothetical protein NQ314_002704 [Rhamnusium bicolor]
MNSSFDKLKELNLSRDEVDRIGEALKKEEFRKLLIDYVEELQDPKNKKLYEEEITQLEKERGVDVTFIHPKPGYVIKTSVNGNQKAFINICVNDHIKKPSSSPSIKEGAKGLSWSLPHSLSPSREDIDNKGARCQVFDIVFHSDTLHLADKNNAFRTMVNSTALEAVEANFDVKLDKKNLKFPKLTYKGIAHASVIRKPSESGPVEHSPEEQEIYDKIFAHANNIKSSPTRKYKKSPRKNSEKNSADDKSTYTVPVYSIKHRSHIDIQEFTGHREAKMNTAIPKELIVEINLPLLKSSTDIILGVTEKTIQLISEKPAKYKLNLTLPYNVNESTGNAKFDKDLKKLVITLPVRYNSNFRLSDCKDDSGVESDHCATETAESEDEIIEKQLSSEHEPSEKCLEKSTQFRTKFLDENVHYNLPEFTCHVFENIIAFTLNVKNVDENSVGKLFDNAGSSIHIKFTSIGSSFYPSYYAFCVKFPLYTIDEENTTIEVWDNNVVLQVSIKPCDKQIQLYLYGISEEDLLEKCVEEPEIINKVLQGTKEKDGLSKKENENQKQRNKEAVQFLENIEENAISNSSNSSIEEQYNENSLEKPQSRAIDILCTSYESSGDELSCSSYSPRKNRGILKRLSSKRFAVGRSISESSLDDFVCSSSFENCHTSLDSVIPEDGEVSTSLKRLSNSSILGQKKKNQRKSKNKKRALERRHSESENSEVDDKKEGDLKDCRENDDVRQKEVIKFNKKEDHDIFHLDIDN